MQVYFNVQRVPQASFIGMPPELRLLIYEQLWRPFLNTVDVEQPFHVLPTSMDLNLLLTCRFVYTEAYQFAYSTHTHAFQKDADSYDEIDRDYMPSDCAARLRPQLSNLIRAVVIPYNIGSPYIICLRSLREKLPLLQEIIFIDNKNVVIKRVLTSLIAQQDFRRRKAKWLQRNNQQEEPRRVPGRPRPPPPRRSQNGEKWEQQWKLESVGSYEDKPKRFKLTCRKEDWGELAIFVVPSQGQPREWSPPPIPPP